MPATQINEQYGIILQFTGTLIFNDLSSSIFALGEDPNFIRVRYIIIDHSKVERDEISLIDVEAIAAQSIGASYRNGNFIVSIVATSERMKELSRYYKELTKKIPVSIFDNITDARKWVDSKLNNTAFKSI